MRKPKAGWRKIFLEELGRWGVVEHACALAGVRRSTAYRARDANPSFAEEWDEAKGKIVGTLEVLQRQRASVGEQKPVYFQGKKIDTIREVDNVGLRWLLAHLKPEVYGEKATLNLNHGGEVSVNFYIPDNEREEDAEYRPAAPGRNGHDTAPSRAADDVPSQQG